MTTTVTKRKKRIVTRIENIFAAWNLLAPETKFAGMTRSEFKTATAASINERERIEQLRLDLTACVGAIKNADLICTPITNQIVAAVMADGQYGPNSPLYRAMGFIPKNERKKYTKAASTPTAAAE